jgi:hypothetical protein
LNNQENGAGKLDEKLFLLILENIFPAATSGDII